MNEIEIYKTPDGKTEVEVQFEGETFWLTLNQIATLFERDKSVISRHLKNIFRSGELIEKATVAKNATVQKEAARTIKREIEYYNLDAILSVGYRVNSKRGTQFRQWTTQRLKDYLEKGFAVNQKRIEQLQQTIRLISKKGEVENLQLDEAKGLLEIIGNYTNSFVLLNQFDSHNLAFNKWRSSEWEKANLIYF
ncbi:MAG: virulence factor [Chitinophagaceae bacterium]|nr:MAG: virulence factor [Chitinophagaceae bacterium]